MLKTIYPNEYKNSSAQANVSSITFAGTVVGMLFFGYTSDHFSRKWSLFTSTIIIILFATLGTASYGAGGNPNGLLVALVVYRFFLGIGKSLTQLKDTSANSCRNRRRIPRRQSVHLYALLIFISNILTRCWLRGINWRAQGGHP